MPGWTAFSTLSSLAGSCLARFQAGHNRIRVIRRFTAGVGAPKLKPTSGPSHDRLADSPRFSGSKLNRKRVWVALPACRWDGMVLALSGRTTAYPSPWRRHVGVAARVDERRSDGELVLQPVIGLDIFRVLAPLPEGPTTRICFPALLRAVGLCSSYPFRTAEAPKRGSVACVCQKDELLLSSRQNSC
jgi:hypothetical protein